MNEVVDARKERLTGDEALALTKDVDKLIVAKGAKLVTIDLKKDKPSRADLLAMLLGPTGNLRAPTLRKGKTLLVGFSEETYARVLGG